MNPEMVEITTPGKEILVLSDLFFTNLVCGQSVERLCKGDVPAVDLEAYIQRLRWRKRWEFRYMKTKAVALKWVERELFRRIATFQDDTNGNP